MNALKPRGSDLGERWSSRLVAATSPRSDREVQRRRWDQERREEREADKENHRLQNQSQFR
jgi:hypothetical protein